jgi:hypothetical protein
MKHTSRRTFLSAAASTLWLPFLPSLAGTAKGADACDAPKRFLSFFLPCGIVMPDWTPTTTGTDWAMPYILAPLEPVRKKLVVLTGLDHEVTTTNGNPGGHSSGTAGYLTMRPIFGEHEKDPNRTSLDQVIAKKTGACKRPLPSMELSLSVPEDTCDNAACPFVHGTSYLNDTPMPHEVSPLKAFNRMFQGFDPNASAADAMRRQAIRSSILDHVLGEAASVSNSLSASDKRKLDEYTSAVRDLETRLQAPQDASCNALAKPTIADNDSFEKRASAMMELIALAFQCDVTRVMSFMMGRGSSLQDWQFLTNASSPHHRISHHRNNQDSLNMLRQINRWEINQLSTLLQRLDGITEADGKTVLDNTVVYCSSEISDGDAHNKYDMPVLLAGGLGGKLKIDGRHISYTQMSFPRPLLGPKGGPHTAHTFVSILNAFDIPDQTFGDAMVSGPNADIMA